MSDSTDATAVISGDQTRRRKRQSGFTLIELLVVLAILGLLAAVVAPRVINYLGGAKEGTAKVQMEHLSTALDLFKLDVGRYPTTEEGLNALMAAPSGAAKWNGPYLKKADGLMDPWGHPYVYHAPAQPGGDYDLSTAGPDNGGNQPAKSQ